MRIVPLVAVALMVSACRHELAPARDDDDDRGDTGTAEVGLDTDGLPDTAEAVDASEPLDAVDSSVVDSTAADSVVFDGGPDTTAGDALDAACVSGTYACASDGELRVCTDGGLASIVKCPSIATCDATNRRCSVCTPGTYRCSSRDRITCTSLGLETSVTCDTPELCAASSGGACMVATCGSGETKCSGKSALKCNVGRTGFDSTACAVGCSGGACLTIAALVGGPSDHFCALLSDGTARCWGHNESGFQIPLPSAGPLVLSPLALPVASVAQVAVGRQRTALRMADGTVRISGDGPGFSTIAGVSGATDIAIGAAHACFAAGATVRCWGDGAYGRLGNGSAMSVSPPSFSVLSLAATGPLALGDVTSFAVVAGGARGWGLNDRGQLGVGDLIHRDTPTATLASALQISAGGLTSCARTPTGVLCSGSNLTGQLGNGAAPTGSTSPVSASGIGATFDLALGSEHGCALLADGTVRCWGRNDEGQLGNGTKTDSFIPVVVSGIVAKRIAAADKATCALLPDNVTVKCWGARELLGDGGTGTSSTPVTVTF